MCTELVNLIVAQLMLGQHNISFSTISQAYTKVCFVLA
jgi:hypothetical protein